jgi:tetratricopeptide (TPR) repeat protein
MVFRRGLVASSLIVFLTFGCSNGAKSSIENSTQVIQESNVTQFFVEAKATQTAEVYFKQGNNLLDRQGYEDAIKAYNKAIAIKAEMPETWINRGIALTSLQHYNEALASYDRAIAIKPNKSEALINRGIALTKLQRYQEAIASYNQAIAIKKDLHQAYYNKACSYALEGNVELAIANLDRAIELVPTKYKKLAKTDPDFSKVRNQKQFQELLQ